jgi:hypothetical protein
VTPSPTRFGYATKKLHLKWKELEWATERICLVTKIFRPRLFAIGAMEPSCFLPVVIHLMARYLLLPRSASQLLSSGVNSPVLAISSLTPFRHKRMLAAFIQALESSSGSSLGSKNPERSAPICPFTEGNEPMTTAAKASQSQKPFAVKTDSQSPGQVPPAYSTHAPKLMDPLHGALRSPHHSRRTEQAYCHWVKRFIYLHPSRNPADMAEPEISAFLSLWTLRRRSVPLRKSRPFLRCSSFTGMSLGGRLVTWVRSSVLGNPNVYTL